MSLSRFHGDEPLRFHLGRLLFHLGVVLPVDPVRWPMVIRRMRAGEGSDPPMMLIASTTVLCLAGPALQRLGLLGGNVLLSAFNYVALATWLAVSGLGCCAVAIDGVQHLRRFGFVAPARPRWWFEVSRLLWIGFVFSSTSIVLTMLLLGGPPNGDAFERLFWMAAGLGGLFMLSATCGYAVSLTTGRTRRGRAFECTQYFWMFGIAMAAIAAATALATLVGWNQHWMLFVSVAAAAMTGVIALKVREWKTRGGILTRTRQGASDSGHVL